MVPDTPVILVINPGSTSTRVAVFRGKQLVIDKHVDIEPGDISGCKRIVDQTGFRKQQVMDAIAESEVELSDIEVVVARGAPLQPVEGGVYRINEAMIADAGGDKTVEHVSKVACLIANDIAQQQSIPAFIVDPVSTDEFEPISRISGLKSIPRKSLVHALNMKRVAREYASKIDREYSELNLVTAHLGGGISIAVHSNGKMIDSVDANGEGPFSPERSGGLRVDGLARSAILSGQEPAQFVRNLTRSGGLIDHLGTSDAKTIEQQIMDGDENAKLVYDAMAYSIAKNIAALSTAVNGKVDAILLTGGLAKSTILLEEISSRVSFIASVQCYPGEFEMEALRDGALRVLSGEETIKTYPSGHPE